jgi:BirA family biotin operon repressor/biotin-[acetyl-CoA-carboxylase] ligase
MMVALSVQQVCTKLCERPVYIKWPNDIFINDRKAGGILIENIISGAAWKWSIIGIGLNINQVDFGELQATSLKAISGKTLEPKEIAARISEELQRNLETLNKEEILAQYQSVLYKKGEKVKFKQGSRSFEGTVQNVTPNGELVVTHGIDEYFNVGDIEWIL